VFEVQEHEGSCGDLADLPGADASWSPWGGEDPDGANRLFKLLVEGTPAAYQRFAEDYYETAVDGEAVSEVFALHPLTDELVRRLNSELTVEDLAGDLAKIVTHRVGRNDPRCRQLR
jgi:hypothetical protein